VLYPDATAINIHDEWLIGEKMNLELQLYEDGCDESGARSFLQSAN
jgi:hypothetical protein